MPDEIEVPLDEVQEHIKELHEKRHGAHGKPQEAEGHPNAEHQDAEHQDAEHQGGAEGGKSWSRFVALSTAILAVVAAIGALQSGLLVNEALLQKNEQVSRLTQASDAWNYYQAEGLKALIYQTAAQAQPVASPVAQSDLAQSKHYLAKQTQLKQQAEALAAQSESSSRKAEQFLSRHHIFAFSVSLCQIAIALSAVAALTQRRRIWIVGLVAGAVGTALLLYGFLVH